MASFQVLRWVPDLVPGGLPRRDRKACEYRAYRPDLLAGRELVLGSREVADIADAERDVARFNESARALSNTEALARLLLRAESVASSKIEGLEVGARRLLRADAAERLGERDPDVTADDVLANVRAMAYALDAARDAPAITVDLLLETHRRLLSGTHLAHLGGVVRTSQNWIGGSSYNPCSAVFVPPPPDLVPGLLIDLCAFCSDDSLPAVAQAAIAHAQFETIHPFADGNGRIGRVLIHLILQRRGLATNVTVPVSLVLASMADAYVRGLDATHYVGQPDSQAAFAGINAWLETFSAACRTAVARANEFETRIASIQDEWRARLGSVRANSALDLLLERLPGLPVINVKAASEIIGRSAQAANEAVARLEGAGILKASRIGRRNRVFEAREVIAAFADLEERLGA
jgi:Fic family protein